MRNSSRRLERAYASCQRLIGQHHENFPVASCLLPRVMRKHIAAVYAFARSADDFADEEDRTPRERLMLLDSWQRRLHASVRSEVPMADRDERDLLFMALADTIRTCDLPLVFFDDLLSAFRQDVTVRRYKTWNCLLDYCRRSANSVGRLLLRIAGIKRVAGDPAADCVCTALQITNFLQDFGHDWNSGRLYVPAEIYESFGAQEADLGRANLPIAWREALAEMAQRTKGMFERGRGVSDSVGGRLGMELRLTWLGGKCILDHLERTGYDPLLNRPTIGISDFPPMLWRALMWRQTPAT